MIRRRSAQHIATAKRNLLPHPVKLGLLAISMFALTLVVTLAPAADGQGAAAILRKTAGKMSPQGRAAVSDLIRLPENLAPLLLKLMSWRGDDYTS